MKKHQILLVEDELNFGSVLKDYLELNNYEVALCRDGESGLQTFSKNKFDLCILDVMLPKRDGFSLGREIRKANEKIPFIYLTAKVLKHDVVEGFRIGADDYITKPFDSELLLCKIKAIINRMQNSTVVLEIAIENEYKIGKYIFNPKLRILSIYNTGFQQLSPRENDLLILLCKYKNTVMPRKEALETIWGKEDYFTARSMDVFIAKLRKYLKEDVGVEIVNIHSSGYSLRVTP